MALPPLDELMLKGTHNSYSCEGGAPPRMNHPPEKQIDDFGAWHLELDFSIVDEGGKLAAVVGHDRPGDDTCWGYYLADFVERIRRARALEYRPVFVCLEVEKWRRSWRRPWRRPADSAFGYDEKLALGLSTFREVCGSDFVLLEDLLVERNLAWPSILDLAGKIVFHEPNKLSADGRSVGMRGTWAGRCTSAAEVERSIADGFRAFRLDQYQADWTFDYGVPPNPIVVDPEAPAETVVDDSEGEQWRCGAETSHGQVVGQHGTYRFPYRTLAQAIERARGVTSATGGVRDPRRAGHGWTVLLRPGHYDEAAIDLDIPLTLLVDDRYPGEVTFGEANAHLRDVIERAALD